jgi:arylsulfatase A-like enzyme
MARFGGIGAGACLPADMPVLGEEMRRLGYTTIGVTSNAILFSPAGFSRGFDQWVEVPDPLRGGKLAALHRSWEESSAMRSAAAVNAAVDSALARRSNDRFFLYVHFMDVHDWAAVKISYDDAVRTVDRGVGVLLDRLESEGFLDDAAVILTADHGESLDEPHLVPTTPRHIGNPSFEPVLAVPLIVSGAAVAANGPLIRSEDLFRMLIRIAGGDSGTQSALTPDELFVTEISYRTYRRGRFKSFFGRFDDRFRLVDLDHDGAELRDVAADHPEVVSAHRARIDELTASLAAPNAPLHEVDPANLDRLRSLGYVE